MLLERLEDTVADLREEQFLTLAQIDGILIHVEQLMQHVYAQLRQRVEETTDAE